MNEFYSNCLLEAIKAKIKYKNEIKLIFIPPQHSEKADIFPHWLWLDTKDGNIYDFHRSEKIKWYQMLWWRGYIRIQPKQVFDRWYKRLKGGAE